MTRRARLQPHVTTVATDDGLVLLDERGGRYWQLNTTAAAILEHLARGADPRTTAEHLVSRYGIGREQAESDVHTFLEQLRSAGLLDSTPDTGRPTG
ncbi:lasso peptide biosynthesis PqqD family chaperone [Streptomyces lavenduligriseus]|uniref:Lasso peptide biosynthesis PqqD family chaperone n=1 Tax=Streptomyces lavenduligriseus TaxID=67315 RepID=A0ABT0NU29_9ACTN|nr:lasso peptide biosynthesis PqqD family chaperone [Streptomyces lavenduligriseus]MCL3994646.1 lasso peptide biosynthesis PqqD family chaperone [Streptomyces lavenduligriseus]